MSGKAHATDDVRGWSLVQVKRFVRDAKRSNEHAWNLIPALRSAILGEAYANIVSGQASETIPSVHLRTLWTDMLTEAGLLEVPS